MKLVVGLGNIGKEYNNTRHNVGFLIVDNYLGNIKWKDEKIAFTYETTISEEKILFIKPKTYMNLSGNAVLYYVNYYKVDINDILVIHDDLDLPKFKYRVKYDSSSGGHNGIKSIISCLGTSKFTRLKIGIDNNKNIETKDFVLDKLSKDEINFLSDKVFKDIIESFIKYGTNKTMNDFN